MTYEEFQVGLLASFLVHEDLRNAGAASDMDSEDPLPAGMQPSGRADPAVTPQNPDSRGQGAQGPSVMPPPLEDSPNEDFQSHLLQSFLVHEGDVRAKPEVVDSSSEQQMVNEMFGKGKLGDIRKAHVMAASGAMDDKDKAEDRGDEDEAEEHYDRYHNHMYAKERADDLAGRHARKEVRKTWKKRMERGPEMNEGLDESRYVAHTEQSQFGGHTPIVKSAKDGHVVYSAQARYKTAKGALDHARHYVAQLHRGVSDPVAKSTNGDYTK